MSMTWTQVWTAFPETANPAPRAVAEIDLGDADSIAYHLAMYGIDGTYITPVAAFEEAHGLRIKRTPAVAAFLRQWREGPPPEDVLPIVDGDDEDTAPTITADVPLAIEELEPLVEDEEDADAIAYGWGAALDDDLDAYLVEVR